MKLESLMYCGALPIRRAASPGDFERNVATTFIMWGCKSVGRDLWAQFSLITASFASVSLTLLTLGSFAAAKSWQYSAYEILDSSDYT